ncbi:pyrophosphatase PpaX [Paenibacillus glycanilyticus]|uniref:Pyrophosphatase PpaX n=1 Tax=Paenibacillus glycanilyticus TaxID=126569 RepID=A0ABQ6NVF8_9BACL|nr:pyrophosphatase PpaX [Paenibacillus glycanilyticus]GMK48813.1 pyrophosphatase PpaX [Paenibacillus glycanilyticus]
MTSNIKTMLFDLDGTIMDTNELIIRSFMESLKGLVPEDFGREHIIPSMGLTLEAQFQNFTGLTDVGHLIKAYRTVNTKLHDELLRPFPYTNEVMKDLHEQGIQIGVVTTKIRMSTERGMKFCGLYDYVDAFVTVDDVVNPKPHPEPVLMALEMLNADPATTIMIGDSAVDMISAKEAGVIPVGVAWSLKGGELLKENGAQYIIDDMRELYAFAGMER